MKLPGFLLAFLVAAFAFRLFYGLSMPFWYEDERQVYLIGLQSFTTGEWPHYGADVVWTGGRVPGALLGWLIRAPLSVLAIPESPAILLNLLSLAALAFFSWYLTRRFSRVPRWLIWSSLFVLPWTLNFSTHVVNPSYVLCGAVLFFTGFFETVPAISRRIIDARLAWALMGFGLFWILQLHMSWVLLPPFVIAAFVLGLRGGESATRARPVANAFIGFIAGSAVPAMFLLPTILRDGVGAGQVEGLVEFQPQHPWGLVTSTARMLSFASFETNRFLGLSTAERVLVFWREPWVLPFALVVTAAGWLHPLWVLVSAFRPHRASGAPPAEVREWRAVRWLFALSVLLVWLSFFWSVRGPQAHSFYLMLPVATLFAFNAWNIRAGACGGRLPGFERLAVAVVVSSIVLHTGLAIDRWSRLSLYADRDVVAAAIEAREYRHLGERRGAGEVVVDVPLPELEMVRADWKPFLDRFSSFDVTIANRSRTTAWVDLRIATTYLGDHGRLLAVRNGVIKRMLQPGETRTFEGIADGGVPVGTTSATVIVIGGEKVLPVLTSGARKND
jgi:hypothetical protein